MSKLSLTEATMLALQGKLEESKPATHRRSKKQENIDVNVDDKTAVSVIGNETIVDTEKATIIVDKKEDEFVPETSDGIVDDTSLPMEAPDEDVVEVPVDGDDTIIPEDEVPVEQADEDEAVLDAEADVDLPLGDTGTENEEDSDTESEDETSIEAPEDVEENKKVESIDTEHATEDIYKSTNLFKALCDEVEDITCEDGEKPSREQIEKAVDIVINGYDYIWEDLHIALKTEIDKITGYNEDTDSFKPRYEAKSKRRSLGKVTEKVIKYSSKTFKEALNKYYTTNTKTIESVDLTKFSAGRNFIKMEVKLTNKDGMVASKILEMKEIAKNKNFTKYAMVENSRIKNESKSNISMLVATNKDKVLECKYIKK